MSNIVRRAANLIFAALLFPAASFSEWSGIGRKIAEISRVGGPSPETPAGYAFAIWGPIFALTIVYAIRQALPGMGSHELYRRIGWATAGSSLLAVMWMLLAQTIGNGWWLVVLIFGFLAFAMVALFRTLEAAPRLDRFDRWIVVPMTGMLAAWLSAAAWLNLSSALKLAEPARFGLDPTQFAFAVLSVIAVFSWVILVRTRGSYWYAGTTVWALAAVAAANISARDGDGAIASGAAGAAFVTIALALSLTARARTPATA